MRFLLMPVWLCFLSSFVVAGELPVNPWINRSPVEDRISNTSAILNVREGSAMRVRAGVGDKPGQRDVYKIDRNLYTGEATTFGPAYGQEMIAPEVNEANILLMMEHLRKIGYNIPREYDSYIVNAPEWYQRKYMEIFQKLNSAANSNNPIIRIPHDLLKDLEAKTGLSLENFFNTSVKVMKGQ